MTDQSSDTLLNLLTPETYFNREMSTIAFNQRVLELAKDPTIPLLERLKFVAIVGSNLDEFYMVRVGSYAQKMKLGINTARPDGYMPAQLISEIRHVVLELMNDQRAIMRELLAELRHDGIHIVNVAELEPATQVAAREYFYNEVFPVLTPLAADHARPFPFISNLSLNIGIYLRHSVDDPHIDFVRLKVPEILPRLVNVRMIAAKYGRQSIDENYFIWIEDLISHNLGLLFPGMDILENHPFRVTRNSDIDYEHEQEEELLDLSAVIEAGVRERRFGSVVRLSVPTDISDQMLKRLILELNVESDHEVYTVNGALGSANLFELMNVDAPDLKYPQLVPRLPEALSQATDIFAAIRQQDILLHHPYDSFSPVEEFIRYAAHDPNVLAIKATLYRVGQNSPIVHELMEARENGKQVAVLVELKARFDEENNLEWARAMETKGVHVTYGVENLAVKTHAKIALVIRKEGDGLQRYVHLGTGNYNAGTARLYTDLGLFTVNQEIAEDATRLFNRLTGYAPETHYNRLLVAPEFLRNGLLDLIDNEIRVAKEGGDGRIVFKMNQLEEDVIIAKLYEASQAGVQIDLIVRGICCLRPGIQGISDNIRVRSIIGRFLEHARIFYFKNAPPDQRIYAGSADIMRRNLYNRVEVVFPIIDPRLQRRVLRLLATDLSSNVRTWELQPNGDYTLVDCDDENALVDAQQIYLQSSFGRDIELQ
jgi:polyphosphate kinase